MGPRRVGRYLALAGALNLGAQAQLHLARSLFRERHGHERCERGSSRRQEPEDAGDELRRFARTGGRLHDERRVEIGANGVASDLVDEPRHQSRSLRRESGTSAAAGFRAVRCSS